MADKSFYSNLVKFNYHGGSDYGALRRVYVTTEDTRHLGGYDLDRKEYRNFNRNHMQNFKVADDEYRVLKMGLLPTGYSTESLKTDYKADGFEVHEVANNTILAVKRKSLDSITPLWGDFTFKTDKGSLRLYRAFQSENVYVQLNNDKEVLVKTPQEFATLLRKIGV